MGLQSTKGTLPTTSFPWDLSFDASFPFNPFRKHLCHWSLQATFETSNFHINVQISSAQTLNLLCRVSACQIDVGDSEPQGKKNGFPKLGPKEIRPIKHPSCCGCFKWAAVVCLEIIRKRWYGCLNVVSQVIDSSWLWLPRLKREPIWIA